MSNFKKVVVKKESQEKLSKLFTWVYKNEIVNDVSHIKSGELVRVQDQNGAFLGIGYFNFNSEITIRILTFKEEEINDIFFEKRVIGAIKKRETIKLKSNAYRVIHSEADYLPGLIVDSYNGYLGIQINSFGMECFKEIIIALLIKHLNPKAIYDKSDSKVRKIEGLETKNCVIYGDVLENIEIFENDIKFSMSLIDGQKTGFYLDQRKNREIVSSYITKNDKILDVFCNAGGFGLYGLKNGASVHFVDISPNAITQVNANIELNGFKAQVTKIDAFDFLTNELATQNQYDMVVLDPPPFAKTKRDVRGAIKGMRFLLSSGVSLVKEGGIVAIFSCSHHIGINELLDIALDSSKQSGKFIEILEILRADSDHPYILNIPNSNYLSGIVLRVE